MKKQNFIVMLYSVFLGLITVMIVLHARDYENSQGKESLASFYQYEGFEDYSIENVDADYFSSYSSKLSSVRLKQKSNVGLIEKPETAAKIGVSILKSKFGDAYVYKQSPYSVYLVNDRIWKVSGNSEEYEKPLVIYNQAADGQVLGIY